MAKKKKVRGRAKTHSPKSARKKTQPDAPVSERGESRAVSKPETLPNDEGVDRSGRSTYGPHNPHPLSTMRTELVWEGKYDEYGNRREVDMAGCMMPMQKIETVDQPRSEAAATGQLSLF